MIDVDSWLRHSATQLIHRTGFHETGPVFCLTLVNTYGIIFESNDILVEYDLDGKLRKSRTAENGYGSMDYYDGKLLIANAKGTQSSGPDDCCVLWKPYLFAGTAIYHDSKTIATAEAWKMTGLLD